MAASRLAVLYGPSIANDHVVAALQSDPQRAPVLVVAEEHAAIEPLVRVARRSGALGARLGRLAFIVFYGLALRRRVDAELRRLLGSSAPVRVDARAADLGRCLEAVRAARPDLILVLGTSILGPEWLRMGASVVNVHVGLAPAWRGRFCWFWPVALGRPDEVGVTLHELSPRVDEGRVVLRRAVAPMALPAQPAQAMAALLAGVTRLALVLCRELLADPAWRQRPATPEASQPPEASGRARLEPGLRDYLRFKRNLPRG
jgi:hypothetical protein